MYFITKISFILKYKTKIVLLVFLCSWISCNYSDNLILFIFKFLKDLSRNNEREVISKLVANDLKDI